MTLAVLSGVGVLAFAGFVYSGVYDVGADNAHTRPVLSLLQTMRERSIASRAEKLTLPLERPRAHSRGRREWALPKLDAAAYHEMLEKSGGHSHGGGESALKKRRRRPARCPSTASRDIIIE